MSSLSARVVRRFRLDAALVGLVISAACGGSSPTTPSVPPSSVTSIVVSGWLSPLKPGQSVQLSATAMSATGSSRSVTAEATWQSSDPTVAVVSQVGLVTALTGGTTNIRATFAGQTGNLAMAVESSDNTGGPLPGLTCGVERWPVKTLSDPDATRVDTSLVQQTTIKALNERSSHCTGLPDARTFGEEFQVYEVVGRVTFVRLEDDRDYHIAVADPSDGSYTMVTEVADIACQGAVGSPHRTAVEAGRNGLISLLGGRPPSSLVGALVRIRGVGFYDFNHGQNGRSRSCIELHPVVSIAPAQ
jgi:hypothetical protein